MRTQARRKYSQGFLLNEQELRRIHDVADQQMKRVLTGQYETTYEVRYKNGAIAEPKKLDEVFEQENWGSALICLVSISARDSVTNPRTKITVTFAARDDATNEKVPPISYEVEGEDRDWVFVASSQLSERISRVERFTIPSLGSLSFSLLALLFMVTMFLSIGFVRDPTIQKSRDELVRLKDQWKKGELRDPVDAVLRVEESHLQQNASLRPFRILLPMLIMPVSAVALSLIGLRFYKYAFPAYNFLWGEYEREYEKRKGRARFILIGVGLTVILGIVANVLTKKIGF